MNTNMCPECHGPKLRDNIVCDACFKRDSTLAEKHEWLPPNPRRPLHDLLDGMLSAERKMYPVYSGFDMYFRDAIFRVARVSYDGNQKHNPGEPIHWARGKSDDHNDCCARHSLCADIEQEAAERAWRAMAHLQLLLEKKYNITPPPGCR